MRPSDPPSSSPGQGTREREREREKGASTNYYARPDGSLPSPLISTPTCFSPRPISCPCPEDPYDRCPFFLRCPSWPATRLVARPTRRFNRLPSLSLSLSLSLSTGEILRLDFKTLASLISRSHSTFIPAASSPFNYNRRLLATPEGVKEVERVCNTLHSYLPDVTPTEVSRLTRAPTTYRHWYRRYHCHVYMCNIYIHIYFQTSFVTTRSIFEIRTRGLEFFHPRKFTRPFLPTHVDIILPNLRFYSKDRHDKYR